MKVFTYKEVGVVQCVYVKIYNVCLMTTTHEWCFYDIHGNSTKVTELYASRFRGFLLLNYRNAAEYKSKCIYDWALYNKEQPRWKRMLAWCITKISRIIE